jgi:hypothetical protein
VPEELVVVLDLPADEGRRRWWRQRILHTSANPTARHARETQSWQRSGGHAQ